jgi:hypothetical protein
MKKFPSLPSEVWALIEGILKHIQESEDKPKAVSDVRAAVKSCVGQSCLPEIKRS